MAKTTGRYGRVPKWAPLPTCSRCGSPDTVLGTVWLNAEGQPVCENCIRPTETIAHGERILAGLEEEADKLRKAWLGDDYGDIGPGDAGRMRKKHGEAPEEMRRLLDCCEKLEETLTTSALSQSRTNGFSSIG